MLGHRGHEHVTQQSGLDAFTDSVVKDVFQFFWMSLFVISSLYSWLWDVYMDWGLGKPEVRSFLCIFLHL
jgi:hypothetical protein